MLIRTLSALLLSALLAAVASSQTPAKDKDSKETKIGDKSLHEWLKMMANTDPAVREQAVAVIATFPGAELKKERENIAKQVFYRLANESDSSVRIALIDLIGAMELEESHDAKEAPRLLAKYVVEGVSALRIHALQALARFGPKAHGVVLALNVDPVLKDPSYQIRVAVAQTLGSIGRSESGPSSKAITILSETMTKDACAAVRLSALQSLFALGPPYVELKAAAVPALDPKDPKAKPKYDLDYDGPVAKRVIEVMKTRIGGIKGATATENDKQIELWCRLVIVRFGGDFEKEIDAIARHLTDDKTAIRLQAVELLSLMGEAAAPKIDPIVRMVLTEKEAALRVAALNTLGAIGIKAIEPIVSVINNPREEPEIRIAALAALARLGEKAERERALLEKIITDKSNVEEPTSTKIALLHQALLTLAAMGEKAKPAVPVLIDLAAKLDEVKAKRLSSPEYIELMKNPEYIRQMARLTDDEKKKIMENQPEDIFKKFVLEATKFINASTPGKPGGEKKAP